MEKAKGKTNIALKQRTKKILQAFRVPNTPRRVEKQLGIKKIKLKSFLKYKLLKLLNPNVTKGRLYVASLQARRLLKLPIRKYSIHSDWKIIGWIIASPKQRAVVIKVLNSVQRTSEDIRKKALRFNRSVTRISTKTILREMVGKGLVNTELRPNLRRIINGCSIYGKKLRRYYWLSKKGEKVQKDIEHLKVEHEKNFETSKC